ncbi:SDR family NAD(P)-dependent oxidoreductase [uncultured Roseobacter sp.]|uniref:SDR family NAD(P)-dependent oxidoreductase n=1 Tax=uncultured Roseobacter sp. TaxID=114847 RepID=UPI00263518B4|nr:SDR family NAD(P)-dependent oxidoreductase [uncultured Roseobacter sp.]
MDFSGKVVAITGGASGIGAALAAGFLGKGAKVAILDLGPERVEETANHLRCSGYCCDVTREPKLTETIREISRNLGSIDIFVSNAGSFESQPDHAASATNEVWAQNWSLHVMAHVYAARALLPEMIARRSGYFVNITSAAGLLNQIGDAAYSATKHAAVSFAESLAITHRSDGIGVSVVCPQYVATPLIGLNASDAVTHESLLTAEQVAGDILDGVADGRFLILPHPQVAEYARSRAENHEKWIKGMVRLRSRMEGEMDTSDIKDFYKLL